MRREGSLRRVPSSTNRGAKKPAGPGRFAVLDGWRGVCAVLVALYHVEVIGEIYAGHLRALPVIDNAYLFVDFFFVLSGFVIAHTYQTRITSAGEFLSFEIRRFGRVWPLHMAILLVFIVLELAKLYARARGMGMESRPFSNSFSVPAIFTNIFLAQTFGLDSGLTWNQPSWSIGAEFYTYLAFALLVLAGRRRFVLAALATALASACIVAVFSPDYMRATFDYGFFRCLYGFFVGVLVRQLGRFDRGVDKRRSIGSTALELALVLLMLLFVSVANARPISLLSPLLFAMAVYVFARERGAVSHLLRTRPFRFAGARSYSIYMTHALVLVTMARIIRTVQAHGGAVERIGANVDGSREQLLWFGSSWSSDGLVLVFLLLLFVTASITYRFIENPGRALFNTAALRLTGGLGRSVSPAEPVMGVPRP